LTGYKEIIIHGRLGCGHQNVPKLKASTLVLKRTESNVAVTAKIHHYTKITGKNIESFHFHSNLEASNTKKALFSRLKTRCRQSQLKWQGGCATLS
jgi:hypothetical protein